VRIRDAIISVAAIVVLIVLLAATDERVRERLSGIKPAVVSHQVARGGGELASAGTSVRDRIVENGPLTLLVVAATVLFVCMLRT